MATLLRMQTATWYSGGKGIDYKIYSLPEELEIELEIELATM